MTAARGTYILVIGNDHDRTLDVGRLGSADFPRGYYLYAGSAFGPGGIISRVRRHFSQQKKCHWHIDALTLTMTPLECWYHAGQERLECLWSAALDELHDAVPLAGFGSSDCHCHTHLHYFSRKPDRQALGRHLNTTFDIYEEP